MTGGVHRLLAIGGSWGGIQAVRSILRDLMLPPGTAAVLVLHRRPVRSELASVLSHGNPMVVVEAEDKAPLVAGTMHVAPPDYHLLVERGWMALSAEDPVKYSRPSVDVLLESAAGSFGDRVVAVVLTGASNDGTDGVRAVRKHGGVVIVQDPANAQQPVMPGSVVEAGLADHVVSLRDLPAAMERTLRAVPMPEEER